MIGRFVKLALLLPVLSIISMGLWSNHDDNKAATALAEVNAGNELFQSYSSLNLDKSFLGFKEALAFSESSGNYFAVNRLGYKGKYQFGNSTLKWVGVTDYKSFLEQPALQERAFDVLLAKNKFILEDHIKAFDGMEVGGVTITESGLLAAAHLGGAGNVKDFLDSKGADCFKDANGVPISAYIEKFGGYDTSAIAPNALARV
ncbi:peptidoglycan-binding protein LysM [Croceiramulus getboli]|nr:peptidoglycan-binding protein LysM [Flavobacteriaceae bacterium YJPT1-3]